MVRESYVFERGFHIQGQLEKRPRLLEMLLHELPGHSSVSDVEEAVLSVHTKLFA